MSFIWQFWTTGTSFTARLKCWPIEPGSLVITVEDEPTSELLADNDCESAGTGDWSGPFSVLSKETANPHGGIRCIRATQSGVNPNPEFYQSPMVIGQTYRVRGWLRGDGTYPVRVAMPGYTGYLWTGTAENIWQYFNVAFVATSTMIKFQSNAPAYSGGYIEGDDLSVMTGSSRVITDDGDGNLVGDGVGTIDYNWGIINLDINVPLPASGTPILADYIPVEGGCADECSKCATNKLRLDLTPGDIMGQGDIAVSLAWARLIDKIKRDVKPIHVELIAETFEEEYVWSVGHRFDIIPGDEEALHSDGMRMHFDSTVW